MTFMTAIRDVWFEPYERAVGDVFLKKMTPKQVVLGGSGEYQFGAIKLGQAEGGLKILLLNVNNFDRSTDISGSGAGNVARGRQLHPSVPAYD